MIKPKSNENASALLTVTVERRRLRFSGNLPLYRTLAILAAVTGYPLLQAVLQVLHH